MVPVVDRLKSEYEGVVEFRIINVETDAEGAKLATELGLQYVPSFVFFGSDGSQQDQRIGELSEEELRSALDALQ